MVLTPFVFDAMVNEEGIFEWRESLLVSVMHGQEIMWRWMLTWDCIYDVMNTPLMIT